MKQISKCTYDMILSNGKYYDEVKANNDVERWEKNENRRG